MSGRRVVVCRWGCRWARNDGAAVGAEINLADFAVGVEFTDGVARLVTQVALVWDGEAQEEHLVTAKADCWPRTAWRDSRRSWRRNGAVGSWHNRGSFNFSRARIVLLIRKTICYVSSERKELERQETDCRDPLL